MSQLISSLIGKSNIMYSYHFIEKTQRRGKESPEMVDAINSRGYKITGAWNSSSWRQQQLASLDLPGGKQHTALLLFSLNSICVLVSNYFIIVLILKVNVLEIGYVF